MSKINIIAKTPRAMADSLHALFLGPWEKADSDERQNWRFAARRKPQSLRIPTETLFRENGRSRRGRPEPEPLRQFIAAIKEYANRVSWGGRHQVSVQTLEGEGHEMEVIVTVPERLLLKMQARARKALTPTASRG